MIGPSRSGDGEQRLQPALAASRVSSRRPSARAIASPIVAISSACELRRSKGAKIRPYRTAPRAAPVDAASSRPTSARPGIPAGVRGPDQDARQRREGADGGELAEGEVDAAGDAVDQRVAGRQQRVDRGRRQRVRELLQPDRPSRAGRACVAARRQAQPVGLEEEQHGRGQRAPRAPSSPPRAPGRRFPARAGRTGIRCVALGARCR